MLVSAGRNHTRLVRAISTGSLDAVRAALESGCDANGHAPMRPPLFAAAERGLADIVELLIGAGANPAKLHANWSAATEADAMDFLELAERLVTLGAPAQSRLAHGYSQLHRAACRGDVEVALASLAPELDPLNARGDTPLRLAIVNRRERAVDALLTAGANPNFSRDGFSILCEAAYQDSRPDEPTHFVARLLAAGADPNRPGYPPLFCTVNQEWSSPAVLQELVSAGARIAATDSGGETVLHRIAEISVAAMVDAALDAHAKIEARDAKGRTPLLAAADNLNPETFSRLMDRGAHVSARDSQQRSIDDLLDDSAAATEIRARLALRS